MDKADETERNLTNTSHNVKWVVFGAVIHILIKQQTTSNEGGKWYTQNTDSFHIAVNDKSHSAVLILITEDIQ